MDISNELKNTCISAAYKKFNKSYEGILDETDLNDYLNNFFNSFIDKINRSGEINKTLIRNKKTYIKQIKLNMFIKFIYTNFEVTIPNIKRKPDIVKYLFNEISIKNTISVNENCSSDFKNLIDIYEKLSSSKDINLVKSFRTIYKAKNFTEYAKKLISDLYKWATTNSKPLVDYRFIKAFNKSKIKNWLNKDLEILFLEILIKNSPKKSINLGMDISPIEYSMRIPIDPSNRRVTTSRDGTVFTYIQQVNKDISVKTVIDIPNIDEINKKASNQKLFNVFDLNILKVLIQKGIKNNDFFKTREVVTDLGAIVNKLPYSKNERIYKEAYKSLVKMSSFLCIYENKLLKEMSTYDICKVDINRKKNYEDSESIIVDEYKKLIVTIVFSKKYINLMLSGAIFTDKSIACKSNIAKALINPLQCERYKKLNDKDLLIELNFNLFFNAVLSMGLGNKSRKLKQIETALDDIQKNAKIIKKFNRSGDNFYIEFYPLFPEERKNILNCINYFNEKDLEVSIPFQLDN